MKYNNMQKFSILITVYDQAAALESNLPALLTQDYEGDYEVIVIDETSTDNTEDVLKLLKDTHPRLYTTFLPKPNRRITRKKLAFNIGVKAAKYEWVILSKIGKDPLAEDVLSSIAGVLDESSPLTLGYYGRKGIRLQAFDDVSDAQAHIRKAERRLRKIRDYHRMSYRFGRYDFIITRKDHVYDVLQYFEQQVPWTTLIGLRLKIFFTNLFG